MIGMYGLSAIIETEIDETNGSRPGEVGAGERLVDDETRHRIRVICVREFSSTQHGNTKRVEVSGA